MFLIQDVSNHPALSLEHPGWHLAFDQDPVEAEATRRRTLEWLAREQMPVQGFHFPVPGPCDRRGRRRRVPGGPDRLARLAAPPDRLPQRLDQPLAVDSRVYACTESRSRERS